MRALHITGHSEICNKSPPSFADPNATSPYRAERGKGRLWEAPANPYCFTNFECKADLSQPFKGNCSQIRSSVTGGAYNSVCRVTMCVRRDLSIGACLNCTRSTHQTVTKRPFSPHSFPARRKRMGRRRCVGNGFDGTRLRAKRGASCACFLLSKAQTLRWFALWGLDLDRTSYYPNSSFAFQYAIFFASSSVKSI